MISTERLREIREFADRDVLDLVEPEEMYYFLGLEEQLQDVTRERDSLAARLRAQGYNVTEILMFDAAHPTKEK